MMTKRIYLIGLLLTIFSCQQADYETLNTNSIGPLPKEAKGTNDNPLTKSKIKLGKFLFYDPVLSGNNKIACASCHSPDKAFTDGLKRSDGFNNGMKTIRNAPTILNAAFNGMDENGNYDPQDSPMFYDNRASSLEEQCLGPLLSPIEMKGPEYEVDEYINLLEQEVSDIDEYKGLFANAFGDSLVTLDRINKALASYERTLITPNSAFDRFARGDANAMSAKQIRGMEAFIEVGCVDCHSGPMFSDYKLHVLGVSEHPGLDELDNGNGNFAFRTTTLRNLELTNPYMHNGSLEDLQDVMDFYEDQESEHASVSDADLADEFQDLSMQPFNLSRSDEIIAFLKALNDYSFNEEPPESVPSGLDVVK